MDWFEFGRAVSAFSLLLALVMWPTFHFCSVRRIEKALSAEGRLIAHRWDPMGYRAFLYSWPIALPRCFFKEIDDRIVNTDDVKRHARVIDRVLGTLFFAGSMMFTITGAALVIADRWGPYSFSTG
ncbi:hypothetical protein [Marinimicrobium alkaliphilum]|uniref:hypothetical protein n=1 Tax=Marinimicrobium alkaliphilum TaxID=2202654 RepID=UPI000DBAC6AF|nr:hypothetical protein [Marinimicrobium alkaliphilum]